MFTDVQIINLGLSKISSSRVNQIDPPKSNLERHMSDNYEHWKRLTLAKHPWVFARELDYDMTLVETLTSTVHDVARPYKYSMPADMLRPLRNSASEWVQRKRFIYSKNNTLTLDYVQNVDETDFDPIFVEVLAAYIAKESAEYVTQSNKKKETATLDYLEQLSDAKKANAFVVGSEDVDKDDSDFPFISERFI